MKIAFLATAGGPTSWNDSSLETGLGGSEAMMTLYAREFARMGHGVECYCRNDKPGEYNGVQWKQWPAEHIKADAVVSLRTPDPLCKAIAPIRAVFANDQKCDALPRAVEDGSCNLIINISKHQKERYQKLYPSISESLFFESSAGVECGAYRSTPKEAKLCLYTSTPERGLEYLITLWPIIQQKCPEARLKVTSGFQLYGASDEQAKQLSGGLYDNLPDGMEYVGPLKRSELIALQSKASLLIYPSSYDEMCCIAALEAAAAGMAIVTSNRAALKERVVHNVTGYLVNGHPSEREYRERFVEYVGGLLQSREMTATFGRAGRIAAARHDYGVLAKQWIERFAWMM